MDINEIEKEKQILEKQALSNLFDKLYKIDEGFKIIEESLTTLLWISYDDYFNNIILDVLNKNNFNYNHFYFKTLGIFALEKFKLEYFEEGLLVKDVGKTEDKIFISTIHGTFEAKLAHIQLQDTFNIPVNSLYRRCHELSQLVLEYKGYKANTSFLTQYFQGEYLHSYNIDENGDYVDYSNNLVMSERQFKELCNPAVISEVTLNEFEEYAKTHPTRGILEVLPFLDIAINKTKALGDYERIRKL